MKLYTLMQRVLPAIALVTILGGCSRDVPPSVSANEQNVLALRQAIGSGEAGEETTVALPTPTGFATIVGTVTINGAAPVMGNLTTTGDDASACGVVPNEAVVVDDATKGIRDVLFYCTTKNLDEAWEHPDYQAQKSAELEYDQRKCRFLSHVFAMRSTQSLKILNTDTVSHNTNLAPTSGALAQSAVTAVGGSTPYAPGGQTDAPFPVTCNIHPWMKAWMITRDNPYFAVTDAQGKFTIKNVPAGNGLKLQFRVWQEKIRFIKDVTVNGESVTWKRGTFELTLEPGQEYQMNVVIDASQFN